MKSIRKILVPTDFSDLSLAAMEYATSVATHDDAEIHLIHVVENVPAVAFHTVDLDAEAIVRNAEKKALEELKQFIAEKLNGRTDLIPIVRCGIPHEQIVDFAKREHVDLIVMATHGRTGLAHVLMGSVVEKVVRESTIPVLTVKPERVQWALLKERDLQEQLHLNL